jgi:predicted RNase H-like HicB family nuclease
MIGNLGEIIWQGANGILVEPEQVTKFGAQAIFKVDRDHWGVFKIPEEIDQFVKISFSCKSDGKICVPPDPQGVAEIGWCVGIGDTIEEAVDHLREVIDQMPEGVHVEFSSIADLMKELQAAKEVGIELTEQEIPDPSTVV